MRPPDILVMAELQFGLVETGLRDCFLRGGGEHEETYIREVSRCLAAYIGVAPGVPPGVPLGLPVGEIESG